MSSAPPPPPCVASTSSESASSNAFFKSVEFTPDGQCLISNSDDNQLRTYILPHDLLTSASPHTLTPTSTTSLPSPITATSLYPFHHPSSPSTCFTLLSTLDHPIRLQSTLLPNHLLASYQFQHSQTERYITPASLLWTSSGTHFLAGADGEIALLDASRYGQAPLERFGTRGEGMKGVVSCLSANVEGVLAAGTFGRQVGLFAGEGAGECVGVIDPDSVHDVVGTGVTTVQWSPCGRYLYVAERQATGMCVYDVRQTGQRLGMLGGRQAKTNQRTGFDVVAHDFRGRSAMGMLEHGEDEGDAQAGRDEAALDHNLEQSLYSTSNNHSIISGGTDGVVRIWENPHLKDGIIDPSPDLSWQASTDAVASAVVHPTCGVVATCSGQRRFDGCWDEESDSEEDESADEDQSADEDESGDDEQERESSKAVMARKKESHRECAIKVWDLGW